MVELERQLKSYAVILLAAALIIAPASNVFARDYLDIAGSYIDPGFYVWAGPGMMEGDVTYRIGGRVTTPSETYDLFFPISELKWPLSDIPVISAGAELSLSEKLRFSGAVTQCAETGSGVMKDSDWTIEGIPDEYLYDYRTIYSESGTTVKVFTVDASLCWWLTEGNDSPYFAMENSSPFGLLAGYAYRSFVWRASNVDQSYPLNPELGHDRVAGPVCDYKAEIRAPYAGITSKLKGDSFEMTGTVGYSPLAAADDEDDHLLRSILSKSKTTGHAYLAALNCSYDISSAFFLSGRADFFLINTDGTAEAVVYAGADKGDTWTIRHKIDSLTYGVYFAAGFKF